MNNIQPPFYAFTTKAAKGRLAAIFTNIGISLPILDQVKSINKNDPRIYNTKALWDTGATNCAITKEVVDSLQLKPISRTIVKHANGETEANVYLVDIFLPNNLVIPQVRCTECISSDHAFGVLIGMSVITLGDFSVTNFQGLTTISFRVPSIHTIDYYQEYLNIMKKSADRNDPCPCGSGKKFKKCCLLKFN